MISVDILATSILRKIQVPQLRLLTTWTGVAAPVPVHNICAYMCLGNERTVNGRVSCVSSLVRLLLLRSRDRRPIHTRVPFAWNIGQLVALMLPTGGSLEEAFSRIIEIR